MDRAFTENKLELVTSLRYINPYVAQVSGTRVRRVRGHEYPIRLEASPKFVGNVGLGAAIIYINFFKIY